MHFMTHMVYAILLCSPIKIYQLYAIYCDMAHELAPINKLHVCTLFLYVPTRDSLQETVRWPDYES